ncbi:MAG: signal recognition particle protein Srp19 [Candidatus Bathyarchaeota archaeon]|nr:signal recognition particle protein Srp19 [Candidatus Bathyarchaeota archaeon]
MRKLSNQAIIWPVYFDASRTRKEGRRVPKNQSVVAPKILEVKEAADRLGLENEVRLDAHFPKMPWAKSGMLLVEKHEAKEAIIRKLAQKLVKIKNQQASELPKKR